MTGDESISGKRRTLAALLLACLATALLSTHAGLVLADQPATSATVTPTDGLNLRSIPGTTGTVLLVIPGGTVVTLTGPPTAGNWYSVQYSGLSGWVDGQYLVVTPPPANSTIAATPTSSGSTGATTSTITTTATAIATAAPASASAGSAASTATVTSSDGLNLRSGPGASNSIITLLPNGSAVNVTGALVGPWAPVSYNGITGWVDGAFLNADSNGTTIAANAASATGGASLSSAAPTRSASVAVASVTPPSTSDMGKQGPVESGLPVAQPPSGEVLKFIWPVASRRISTRFSGYHQAIDIDEFPAGHNPVRAIADGIVTFSGGDACCSYGLYVIIQHANGFSSLYAHFSGLEVQMGQAVTQGQEIGRSGSTGRSTGAHLHFAIYYHHDPLDPLSVLPPGADFE